MHEAGFPIAAILAEEPTGTVIGQPFFVMAHLDAADDGGDERAVDEATAAAFVTTLRRLHGLDPAGIEFDLARPPDR